MPFLCASAITAAHHFPPLKVEYKVEQMKVYSLTHIKAQKLPAGKHNDGSGLWLWKKSKGRGSWVLRIVVGGRRREAGLGPWPEVGIAEARERAAEMRRQVRDGVDPIDERRKARHRTSSMTVKEAVESCFIAKQAELKGDGKHGRWMSPVKHVIAKIGNEPIESVDQHTIKQALGELWHEKPETARKALNRLGMSLTHASAHGLNVDLQAVLKAKALLGKQQQNVRHIPSLHYSKVPVFYQMLCAERSMTCLALRFLILTLARTSEIRFAMYTEIKDDVWTIPAERTKAKSENRIPLTDEALKVIKLVSIRPNQKLLFPSPNDKPLSDATMSRFMERAGYEERPHGFRASFRSWAEEISGADYATMEASLGHVVGSEVVRAYQRSDLLEKRQKLLQLWSAHLSQ